MKRTDFIKLIAAGSGSFLLPGAISASEDLRFDLQEVVIYDNYIRGMKHYRNNFDLELLKEGLPVVLERESENPYDVFAVKVMINGRKVGYLPAYENVVLANLMDKGVRLTAVISNINRKSKDPWLMQVMSIRITTRLMVPINHLKLIDLTEKPADDSVDVYRQGPEVLGGDVK